MKASLLCILVLVSLFPPLSGFCPWEHFADPRPMAQSLSEYFEPGVLERSEPLPIKQIIGIVIAGLALFVILLFVFSFLMGPGERIREKMSETSDPFFTIVAVLLIVLFLSMVQTYYNEILEWLKTMISSV
jgi:O-antigen/teichoic acid export membrane protein